MNFKNFIYFTKKQCFAPIKEITVGEECVTPIGVMMEKESVVPIGEVPEADRRKMAEAGTAAFMREVGIRASKRYENL